jgi:hypothetical protein
MTPQDWASSLLRAIARFPCNRCGASATIVAIVLPTLIGFGALAAETGLWYTIKIQNQSAADAAAISAAYEVIAGRRNLISDLIPAASEAAAQNGYMGSTPEVIYPYSGSTFSDGIAVKLQQTQKSLLAVLFLPAISITNQAVAAVKVLDNSCILTLGTSSTDVEIAASTRLDMPNCSIATNSNSTAAIKLNANTSSLVAATLATAGEISLEGNPIDPAAPPSEFSLRSPARIGAPIVADPYLSTLTHSLLTTGMPASGYCTATTTSTIIAYPSANCVIPGLHIAPGYTVDLSPGTYWVTGNLIVRSTGVLKCSTCDNVKGIGVTIILTTRGNTIGYVSITDGILNLNAPNSGPFAGLVIAQDANGLTSSTSYRSSHSSITGGLNATLNGLVYFPKSSMTFYGNPSTAGPKCLILVVNWLDVIGNSSLDSAGCASMGLANLPRVSTVALAE